MPKTAAELRQMVSDAMFDHWLDAAGLTADDFESFAARIPVDVAEAIERASGGRVRVSDWPRVLPRLHAHEDERIIRPMDVNTQGMPEDVKRGAARATRKHPAQKRLYKRRVTITKLAAELREGRPRVSAWFAEGVGNRPIPRRHAEYLREKYGIPLSDWSRIAD